jgi:hypothetical protein
MKTPFGFKLLGQGLNKAVPGTVKVVATKTSSAM